jgi:hypothetical protein
LASFPSFLGVDSNLPLVFTGVEEFSQMKSVHFYGLVFRFSGKEGQEEGVAVFVSDFCGVLFPVHIWSINPNKNISTGNFYIKVVQSRARANKSAEMVPALTN